MKKNTNLRKVATALLALLISASHGAGAMGGGEDPLLPDVGVPHHMNRQEILQEIQDLTARMHAGVDQALVDYRRDTAAYHRRMGTPVPRGLTQLEAIFKLYDGGGISG